MIKIGSYYQIVASEVESITLDQGNAEYPYRLKVTTKTGREYSVAYQNKAQRDQEAARVANAVDREAREPSASIDIVRYLLSEEVNKLRPYLRRIEKALKEAAP